MSLSVLSMQLQFQQHMLGEADATPLISGTAARQRLGLDIYVNAYRLRLLETLVDAYAKTQAVMGDIAFEAAAFGYIAIHPPITRNLRWYGDQFSTYLADQHADAPALAEIARLDWALRTAFDGVDSNVMNASALAALEPAAWETLRLVPVPTAGLLVFRHNTVAVWQALNAEEPPPAWDTTAAQLDWLIWRKGLQPHFRSVSPLEATLLRAMLEGHAFADCCARAESMCESTGEPAANMAALIGGFLQQWLAEQVLDANSLSTQTLQP